MTFFTITRSCPISAPLLLLFSLLGTLFFLIFSWLPLPSLWSLLKYQLSDIPFSVFLHLLNMLYFPSSNLSPLDISHFMYFFLFCVLQLEYKSHKGRSFCLFCSLFYLWHLEQHLAQSRCFVNIC